MFASLAVPGNARRNEGPHRSGRRVLSGGGGGPVHIRTPGQNRKSDGAWADGSARRSVSGAADGAVALAGAKAWRSRDLCLGSDRHGELIERDGQPPVRRLLSGQLVVSRRTFRTKAWPPMITLALRSCLSPRIGRSRAFSRPCRPQLGCWHTARFDATVPAAAPRVPSGTRPLGRWPPQRGHLGRADRLLEEPAGRRGVSVRSHEHVDDLAELVDRAVDVAPPASDLHRPSHRPRLRTSDPDQWRRGRAASASSGANRCTHR
jgi:hypothetical protein